MPFYEIIHHTKLDHKQRDALAQGITSLHSKTFSAPSYFVNIKFSPSHNASTQAPSAPTVPEYYIAGQSRAHPNIIFAHVRGGASRSQQAFNNLSEEIERIWDEVGGPLHKPKAQPAETHPQASDGEEEEGKESQEPEANWNDGRRLQAVFVVPGIIARESGFNIPEAGGEREWIQQNLSTFKWRAAEGDVEMRRLVDEVEGREQPDPAGETENKD